MSTSQVASDAGRYDLVWGSFNNNGDNDPSTWRQNSNALVSRYYIITEDNTIISGNNLQYWQTNHPDWMLYACDSSGNPTRDLAYTPGDGFKDIALNIHNQAAVNWQVNSLVGYVLQNGYNTLALDEVIFSDFMVGGNPAWGQTKNNSEFACGTWDSTFTNFTKIYNGRNDPTWIADVLNWVQTAHNAAAQNGLKVIVNHPANSNINDPNENALLSNIDVTMNEAGFSDYGVNPTSTGYFTGTLRYMQHVQAQGKKFVLINKFNNDGGGRVSRAHLEYSIATYLIGNNGNADLFTVGPNGVGQGYGAEQYYQEYGINFGNPCPAGVLNGGVNNPDIYYRAYTNGLAIVNAGNTRTETMTLPNHQYTDIENQTISGNTVSVNPNSAYVLTTNGGNGCQ